MAVKKPHGSVASWKRGCRCDVCVQTDSARRAAAKIANAKRNKAIALGIWEAPKRESKPHGTVAAWKRGCRCAECEQAIEGLRVRDREYRRKLRQDPEKRAKINAYMRDEFGQAAYVREWRKRNPDEARARSRMQWASQPIEKRSKLSRERNLRHFYGLTVEQFDRLGEQQGWRCAICHRDIAGLAPYGKRWRRKACVDHRHDNGRVRALLCVPCNTGLGQFGDDIARMLAAVAYLQRHATDETVQAS